MYESLKSYPNNTLMLTVNRRLALRVQQHLAQPLPKAAQPIYAIADWFELLWQSMQAKGLTAERLLTQPQEQALWLQTLQASVEGDSLLQPYQAAKQLMSTWKLLWQWNLKLNDLDWAQQEEGMMFLQWAQAFEATLESHGWITQVQMPTKLLDEIQEQDLAPIQSFCKDQPIVLIGFDDVPPQIQLWLDALQHHGWTIEFYSSGLEQEVDRLEFSDPAQELEQAVSHANQWRQQNKGVFALIIPDLTKNRRKVEHTLNQICDVQACLGPQRQVSDVYNISAAMSLSQMPVIQALMYSFEWLNPKMSVEKILAALHTPYLGTYFSDQKSRELFAYHLKQASQASWTIEALIHLSQKLELEELSTWFEKIARLKKDWLIKEPISQKHNKLMEWLKGIGWPGERPLDSIEHQAVASFYQQVNAWLSLQTVQTDMTGPQAIQTLTYMLQDSAFAPESKPAPIQVMGLLEAAGQEFDRAWILGMNHETWPPPPKPNPFIPLAIQKELKMPHASAERELLFASELTQSLKNCAPHVTFSHALSAQGKHFFASPLLASLEKGQFENQPIDSVESLLHQQRLMLPRPQPEAIPLHPQEEFYGGVAIIQDQAACAFKAFARFRLHAQEPERYEEGIQALDRGLVVHRAMELIWRELKDQKTLMSIDEFALSTLIDKVLSQIESDPRLAIEQNVYWSVEKRRLKNIVDSWLALERKRAPFKVVQLEKKTRIALKGLTLKCRIDRVDVNEDGQAIIIDYKTGQVNLNDCFGERPLAPQLPLYCFADFPPDPKGVVFAVLKRDQCAFIGVSQQEGIPGVSTVDQLKGDESFQAWDELIGYWQPILEQLSEAFAKGVCEVEPKTPQTCLHCDLSSVCRVGEVA